MTHPISGQSWFEQLVLQRGQKGLIYPPSITGLRLVGGVPL
jgi:hypothetical protein